MLQEVLLLLMMTSTATAVVVAGQMVWGVRVLQMGWQLLRRLSTP